MNVNYYASDYWKSYEEFIPAEKYLQTKAGTYTVAEYDVIWRDLSVKASVIVKQFL